jgi:hypothetical protein
MIVADEFMGTSAGSIIQGKVEVKGLREKRGADRTKVTNIPELGKDADSPRRQREHGGSYKKCRKLVHVTQPVSNDISYAASVSNCRRQARPNPNLQIEIVSTRVEFAGVDQRRSI